MKLERQNETRKGGFMKHKQVGKKLIIILNEKQKILEGKMEWLEEIGE